MSGCKAVPPSHTFTDVLGLVLHPDAFGVVWTRAEPGDTVYDLRGLRRMKDQRTRKEVGGPNTLWACINTAENDGGAIAWINTRKLPDFFRRTWESKRHKAHRNSGVPAREWLRALATRRAIEEARLGGYSFVVIRHET